MPAPTNIDFANAFDIGTLATTYTTTQDVNDGGTTYDVYYKHTPAVNGMVSINPFGDLSAYFPQLNIYSPDTTTLWPTGSIINVPGQFYGIKDQTYYFKISHFPPVPANVSPAVLTLTAERFAASTIIPSGSIAINDDTNGLPLALISGVDATPLQYINNFPAGEYAAILDSGIVAVEDRSQYGSSVSRIGIFGADYVGITTYSRSMPDSGVTQAAIGTNNVDKFYIGWPQDYDADPSDGHPSFIILDDGGTAITAVQVLEGEWLNDLAPNNDETILYYAGKDGSGNWPIKRWDLVNSVGLSNLAADIGSDYRPVRLLVLGDDSIVVLYHSVGSNDDIVKIYDAAGATLATYTYTDTGDTRIASDPSHDFYWIWTKNILDTDASTRFRKITPATGAATVDLTGYLFEKGAYNGAATATPSALFGTSESCPFWITRDSVTPPSTGNIIVNKVTVPNSDLTDFDFTAGGGLSPDTFQLAHGGSQNFTAIPVGSGYSILEATVPGYGTVYLISNGSSIDNITVAADETVVVTVTNTKLPAYLSGIYKIVPGKPNDTLWLVFDPKDTIDVKIPDPFAKTALLGS